MNIPDIYIIGSGNVAWHLTHAFSQKNLPIKGIWSKNTETALQLSESAKVPIFSKEELKKQKGIFFLIVTDSSIEKLAEDFKHQILIHCAGSIPLSDLQKHTTHAGVFYPLQTFSKSQSISFTNIPILLESSNQEVSELLVHLCNMLSCKYYFFNSEQRLYIHLAAVMVNNFTNFIYSVAYDFLLKHTINPELLHSLIKETANKAISSGPLKSQTGPAIRNDTVTIEKHLSVLENVPELKKFYSFVTEYIQRYYKNHE